MRQKYNVVRYSMNHLIKPDAPLFPLYALIGSTDRCNIKCAMCPRQDPELTMSEMSLKQYCNLIDRMPYLHAVSPVGLGEPLLHKDIFEMIKYSKKKNIDTSLYSNGTLLTPEIAEKVLDSGLDVISFSFDGATPETFESIRSGARYYDVYDNIRYLVDLRDESKSSLKIQLEAVMMRDNLSEMPALIRVAHDLGVDSIGFGDLECSYNIRFSEDDQLRTTADRAYLLEIVNETYKQAAELGVEISDFPKLEQQKKWSPKDGCKYPWIYISINTKGDVTPCCAAKKIVFGNVFSNSIEEIWHGPEFATWRERMKSDNPPNECTRCVMF